MSTTSPNTRYDLEFFPFLREKQDALNQLEIEKNPLFIISILALFFTVIRRRKTKCGITFGGSCQIRNQLAVTSTGPATSPK